MNISIRSTVRFFVRIFAACGRELDVCIDVLLVFFL